MSADRLTPLKPTNMVDLAEIAHYWQKNQYISFRDRERVLDLAAVGVIVQQLSESPMSIAPELKRIIEIARTNRGVVKCNLS